MTARKTRPARGASAFTPLEMFQQMRWIDQRPLLDTIEPYRRRLFEDFFTTFDGDGRPAFNLALVGRAKKNWKSSDLVLGCLYALITDAVGGNQCYLVANDEDQAADNLSLAKLLIRANEELLGDIAGLMVRKNIIERKDGAGFLEILPARDAVGQHGKTFRLLGIDEAHGYRNWDLLEALAPDPTRLNCQTWITSYATLFHRPGVPLFDLMKIGREGTDPRLLFSWYAADFSTDPACAELSPEARANPSQASWGNEEYLAQQKLRLPSHKYRRLHLNLPGQPEGSAFQAETVIDAVDRGTANRPYDPDLVYFAFVDMSGGSVDDAVLGISHRDDADRVVLDLVQDQGPRPPFDPRAAVDRFAATLKAYHVASVTGDKYAGETFLCDFARHAIGYRVSGKSKSQIYEQFEPILNGRRAVLADVPAVEQQLLGLVWRGGSIDHQPGEHDDYANAAAGALVLAHEQRTSLSPEDLEQLQQVHARGAGGMPRLARVL